MANETPQFFTNRDRNRLFGVLHQPDGAGSAVDTAVVFCAPLFEEKLWAHRVGVNFARFLALRGVAVLRFDYFGDGESEGRFEQASVTSRLGDIHDALRFCRQQTGANNIHLVGLCYGATLAVAAAASSDVVNSVVAWAPVIDGERYIGDLLRSHLSAQMVMHRKVIHDREALVQQILAGQTVSVEGYEIGRSLYTQMVELNLTRLLETTQRRVLVQQISPNEKVEAQYSGLAALANDHVRFEAVRELKFWLQQKTVFPHCEALFERAATWFLEHRSARS